MNRKFKSKDEINELAALLKERRLGRALTLKNIEKTLEINCGQLSRFEAGAFKTMSKNLQKLCAYLQITRGGKEAQGGSLGARLEGFAARSPQHRTAAEELLSALERLS